MDSLYFISNGEDPNPLHTLSPKSRSRFNSYKTITKTRIKKKKKTKTWYVFKGGKFQSKPTLCKIFQNH